MNNLVDDRWADVFLKTPTPSEQLVGPGPSNCLPLVLLLVFSGKYIKKMENDSWSLILHDAHTSCGCAWVLLTSGPWLVYKRLITGFVIMTYGSCFDRKKKLKNFCTSSETCKASWASISSVWPFSFNFLQGGKKCKKFNLNYFYDKPRNLPL